MTGLEQKLLEHLTFLYGKENVESIDTRILERLSRFQTEYPDLANSEPSDRVSEGDAILITYGDMVQKEGEKPLQILVGFLSNFLEDVISTIHILPFYPYSSDDGFSVMDYKQVNPDFGDWEDIVRLGGNFRLMFDAVVNHVSAQSAWFQGFLKGDPDFEEYFTIIEPGTDLSRVFRPRAAPVLTPFEIPSGEKLVWTTFSADQIDLNFANPEVLIEVIDILLFYAAHGAEFIRLDAVTFVWKEIGTTCINSAHTHRVVQCIRTIFDIAAPKVAVITETNVPHEDNIAYFGDGTNEAQMVYNFALPLFTLNAFHTGDATILSRWAATLDLPSDQATFFNFLACHDGIGMLPVKNILSLEAINKVIDRTLKLGGNVSYKSNEDGSQSPYELNINYLDALNDPEDPEEPAALVAKRFLSSQSIMLSLRGVPGIYFHSLFGSRNWRAGVEKTGRFRTINREKLNQDILERELADQDSIRHHVFEGFQKMLKARCANPAFHPLGGQEILSVDKAVFALLRTSLDQVVHTLCLHNVTNEPVEMEIDLKDHPITRTGQLKDILNAKVVKVSDFQIRFTIAPYQVLWLQPLKPHPEVPHQAS